MPTFKELQTIAKELNEKGANIRVVGLKKEDLEKAIAAATSKPDKPEPKIEKKPEPKKEVQKFETFQKIGNGTMKLRDGRLIVPFQIFEADENDIPKMFRDTVVRKGEKGFQEKQMTGKPIMERAKGGRYTVYNSAGEKIAENISGNKARQLLKEIGG